MGDQWWQSDVHLHERAEKEEFLSALNEKHHMQAHLPGSRQSIVMVF